MHYSRRQVLQLCGLSSLGLALLPQIVAFKSQDKIKMRAIPRSGEKLPVVGLGTWQTFDVGSSESAAEPLKRVLKEMHKLGGTVIDSSPMYGSSEAVVGRLTAALGIQDHFFYATKVWTSGMNSGIAQMKTSLSRMQRSSMDLMQIHNLLDWKTHLPTLKKWKDQGLIRYWGITHYTDSSHSSLERIIKEEAPDFVQFNYSIRSRHAEKSLLDTCGHYQTAVIINQPYDGGSLFGMVRGKELPPWCEEYNIASWGQFFLKFILADERVNCVIPGTSKPHHMIDNMMAGYGSLPDAAGREKMAHHLKNL